MKFGAARTAAACGLVALVLTAIVGTFDPPSNFATFYSAGLIYRTAPADLYDLETQEEVQNTLVPFKGVQPFGYPPIVAVLFVPLTFLSYPMAYTVLVGLNILLLGWRLCLLGDRIWCACFALPVYALLWQGQVDALLDVALVAFVWAVINERHRTAGVLSALLLIKPTIGIFVWAWILMRNREAVLPAVGVGALLFWIPMIPTTLVGYLEVSKYMATNGLIGSFAMPTLRWALEFAGQPEYLYPAIAVAIFVAFIALHWKRPITSGEMSGLVILALVCTPHARPQTLILWIIPAWIWLSNNPRLATPVCWTGALSSWLLMIPPIGPLALFAGQILVLARTATGGSDGECT